MHIGGYTCVLLGAGQVRFVTCWTLTANPCGQLPEHGSDARRRFGHLEDIETGGRPEFGVCAAVDMHHLGTGGARAAVVLAAEAVFVHVLAERTAVLPRVPPY